MGNRSTVRLARQSLTEAERLTLVRRFGKGIQPGARSMGVSEQTYAELISPGGRVTGATLARVRAWLEGGSVDPDTGEVRHG